MSRIAYGKRGKVRSAVKAAALSAPEQFTALALPFLPELVEILIADARDRECIGHRTAVSGMLDGLKITQNSGALVEAFLARIGATSEDELARGFERGKMAGEADLPAVDRRGIDYFRRRMQAEPGFRRQLLWELFGVREVESESTASRASLGVSGSLEGKNGSDHA